MKDNGQDKEEGFWTVDMWLDGNGEYAGLNRAEIGRRARAISAAGDLFVGKGQSGTVLTGLAIRLAAEAQQAVERRKGEDKEEREAGDAAVAFLHEQTYENVLGLFKAKGSSFEAWCRRMGFDERKARHAVIHPEWTHRDYTAIRKALRAAVETLKAQ